ncbi:hypothetical protein C0Q70_06136 [Pomacea canaliculata]|uniref:Uncharacterized protein n=1 Tax=Pomacea canaliculata TaxID=400727 RepID=A0A2T7PNC7_POMCA|nr:hypothetical protein C0Q70_06136 [Pomacea canaliculata]
MGEAHGFRLLNVEVTLLQERDRDHSSHRSQPLLTHTCSSGLRSPLGLDTREVHRDKKRTVARDVALVPTSLVHTKHSPFCVGMSRLQSHLTLPSFSFIRHLFSFHPHFSTPSISPPPTHTPPPIHSGLALAYKRPGHYCWRKQLPPSSAHDYDYHTIDLNIEDNDYTDQHTLGSLRSVTTLEEATAATQQMY